jgi:TPP-dependent pyruvate/acetoin dehydrogenase alpha subunit
LEALNKNTIAGFYETMLKIRFFEERVEKMFIAGEIPGFVHLYIGEEAIATGVCANLRKEDYIESTHRGHGHTIAKGADINRAMAEILGKKTGFCKGKGGSMHIADFSVGMLGANGVVGGGYNLAVGAALACKMQKRDNVSVVFFGDGASNRGTFHEAANMAAIWKLPVLFVCEMNCWASTTPYRTTTSVENISDRAAGYGMPGVIVDGNDVFEVYNAVKLAVERARRGGGPTLIEAKTYRIKGHFVGDPELYRTKEEVQKIFEETDPIKKFEKKAVKESLMTKKEMEDVRKKVERMIDESVEYARNSPYPEPSELFDDLYE